MIPFTRQDRSAENSEEIGKHWGVCFDLVLEEFKYESLEKKCQEAFDIIRQNFDQVNLEDLRENDVVVYHEKYEFSTAWGCPQHFGIIIQPSNDLNKIRVKSQWGWTETYLHYLPVAHSYYGNHVTFWRHRPVNSVIPTVQNLTLEGAHA